MLKKLLYTFMAFLLAATSAKAQYPNYAFQAATGTYTNITGTSATLLASCSSPTDEGYTNGIPIGFSFNYNGTAYTTINVSTNGLATFGANFTGGASGTACCYDNNATGLTSFAGSRPILAPFWDDLDMTGGVQYATTGTAPNRVFTLQFKNALWDYSATTASLSFQIKLYETTNVIEFVYNQEAGAPANTSGGASIGITTAAIGSGNFLSLSDASAAPVASYTTETKTIGTRPATGQIYRWSPFCTATINQVGASETIKRVQFGTIDKSSPGAPTAPAYENFTNVSTTLQPGGTTPITITLENSYFADKVYVWIDFNNNGVFTDPGELVFTSPAGAGPFTGNITVPLTATLGLSRMRIRLDDTGSPPTNNTPCGVSEYGNIEDYSIFISLCSAGAVTVQPANTTVCDGGNGSISVTATGTGITYQWQVSTNGGTSFSNLANGAPYSGVTTNTLVITGATTAMNTYQYRVLLNGTCTPANTPSNAATLTVNSPTAITTQPVATQACAGNNASFTGAASNNANYQWQISTDGGLTYTDIGGATSATLNLTAVTNSMNGNRYRFVASVPSCNSVISNAVILTVNPLPLITLSVAPISKLYPTLTTVLSAAVTPASTGNTFKWFKNGVQFAVANASSSSLTVNVDGIGDWTAQVTDSKGCVSALSNVVSITDSINNKVYIYPNPSKGVFHIRFYTQFFGTIPVSTINPALIRTATIIDSKGTSLFTKTFAVNESWASMDVDMTAYRKGIYFIDLRDVDGKRLVVGKIIIQ